jgi:hypothetical protein
MEVSNQVSGIFEPRSNLFSARRDDVRRRTEDAAEDEDAGETGTLLNRMV